MQQTAVFPGRYVQAEDALSLLGDEIARLGQRALLIAGGSAARSILPEHLPRWQAKFGSSD